ncbi:hypothetical protein JL722_14782 [Aureococcus anophagefferens]|nr:hypothetical protein JL722_14782 [Aureococcus anophagefferens]
MASFAPGPSATPSSDATDWQDITDDVAAAASSFTIDELLSADTFSLFESMSACELLDPKMDALGNEAPQPSVEERLRAGTIPLRLEWAPRSACSTACSRESRGCGVGASPCSRASTRGTPSSTRRGASTTRRARRPSSRPSRARSGRWRPRRPRSADIYEEDFCASSGASGSGVGTDDRARALALAAEERLEALGGPDADAAARHVRHRRLLVEGLAAMLNTESSNATVLEAMVDALNGGGDAGAATGARAAAALRPEALQGRYAEHGHLRVLRLVDLVGAEDRGGGRLCLPRSLAALELGGDGARLRQLLSHDDFGVHASSVVLGKGAKKCSVYSLVQYLYNWALRHSLLLMEQCLALDVHLELIASPKELEQVFWYWEYLLAARGTVASSAARHRVLCANANAAARAADPGYDDDAVYVAASLRHGAQRAPCFADPPHVSFADYERVAGAQRGGAAGRLADSASDLFQNAKQLLDQAAKIGDPAAALAGADVDGAELRALMKVAVANRVNIVREQAGGGATRGLDVAFKFHEHFPVLSSAAAASPP